MFELDRRDQVESDSSPAAWVLSDYNDNYW